MVVLTPVVAAFTVPSLWHCFEWAPGERMWKGAGAQESAWAECTVLAHFVLNSCPIATLEQSC